MVISCRLKWNWQNIVDEGDELISTTLAEKERLKENLDNKIRKPKYDPYAEEYDADTGEKKMLSKYDEDGEGKKRKVRHLQKLIGIADSKKTFVLGRAHEPKTKVSPNAMGHSNSLTAISLEYDSRVSCFNNY